jgi:oxygen-independent coproporphyrinogen-3 oxidase
VIVAAPTRGRIDGWVADPGFGIYVHIPFCAHRCGYCDFNTYEGLDALHAPYVDALIRAISQWDGPGEQATSVFFGGGTPTMLPPDSLGLILQAVRNRFGIVDGAEVTVEANPETIDDGVLAGLLEAGFDRISMGVQSLAPRVLAGLERKHTGGRAIEALRAARRAGFRYVSGDLIYGSVWESPDDLRRSVEGLLETGVDHVSAYALTIEEGTPLATLVKTGRVGDVDPDVQADRFEIVGELLGSAGYRRYEISNWARAGHESQHNLLYWCAGDYIGFGAGAHSHVGGRRWWATRLPRDFIDAATADLPTESGHEDLIADARAGEALMLGLRLVDGIPTVNFRSRFGPTALEKREEDISALESMGLLQRDATSLRLSAQGTLLANEVVGRLL